MTRGSRFIAVLIGFTFLVQNAEARAGGSQDELGVEIIRDETGPTDYGEVASFLVVVENQANEDLAICWSSLGIKDFLAIEVSENGQMVVLGPESGPHVDYKFSINSDIIILPSGGRHMAEIHLLTDRLTPTASCQVYEVTALYYCPDVRDRWDREHPQLVTGKVRSRPVRMMVDSRPPWRRWLTGPCGS